MQIPDMKKLNYVGYTVSFRNRFSGFSFVALEKS